jgi:hypothetical protein
VVGVDGRSDSLPPETVVVRVASILPAGSDPAATVIEAELAPVPETVTTPVPLLVLLGVALLVVAPTTWWWRRRRRPGAAPSALGSTDATIPVDAWAEDGESRAVAAASARMMRRSLLASLPGAQPGHPTSRLVAQADVRRPALPVDDLVQVLGELEAAAFDRSADADVGDLARRAGELRSKLPGPSA